MNPSTTPHVLVVEDDPKIARSVELALRDAGFRATVVAAAPAALPAFEADEAGMAVVDWMLPGGDGLQVIRALRARQPALPVLMLTARDSVQDRVAGLEAGADDYLVKPFALAELVARVRALLRRGAPAVTPLTVGELRLDPLARRAWRGDELLDLTGKEFEILRLLMENPGEPVSRRMIAAAVWNDVPRATPLDNVIEVHVGRLRRKVDTGDSPRLIATVRGLGYRLEMPG